MSFVADPFGIFENDRGNFDFVDYRFIGGDNIYAKMDENDEIQKFLDSGKAEETLSKDKSDYKRFKMFLVETNENERFLEIEDIPPNRLDVLLCNFFINARKFNKDTKKYNGDHYQPDSLTSIRNSLQRVLSERGSQVDIKKSILFDRSRKVLAAKRK